MLQNGINQAVRIFDPVIIDVIKIKTNGTTQIHIRKILFLEKRFFELKLNLKKIKCNKNKIKKKINCFRKKISD